MSRTNKGYRVRVEYPTNLQGQELEDYKQAMLRKHGPHLDTYRVQHEDGDWIEARGNGVGDA